MALKDLYLVGLGIKFRDHLTDEARTVLKRCRVVFHIGEGQRRLKKLSKNVVDRYDLYWMGEERAQVYTLIRAKIIEEMANGPGVAYATYGHPMLFDDIAHGLLKYCKKHRRSVRVLSGISSLDTVATDLRLEYADGLQVYSATRLVSDRRKIDNRVQAILMQLAEFNFRKTIDRLDQKKGGRYAPLVKYLRRYYPAQHPVTIVYSDDGDRVRRSSVWLAALDAHRGKIFPGTSLFLPPLEQE